MKRLASLCVFPIVYVAALAIAAAIEQASRRGLVAMEAVYAERRGGVGLGYLVAFAILAQIGFALCLPLLAGRIAQTSPSRIGQFCLLTALTSLIGIAALLALASAVGRFSDAAGVVLLFAAPILAPPFAAWPARGLLATPFEIRAPAG